MRIDQIVVSAAPGDAVTNSALEYRSLLRAAIGQSDVFALHVDGALAGDVFELPYFEKGLEIPRGPDDIVIFHASIGAPDVFAWLLGRTERLVLVYHNVSPASAYREYDPAFAGLLESGRRDIARLKNQVVLALTPSEYNAAELRVMGYRNVNVVPLVIDVARLSGLPQDAGTSEWLQTLAGPVLLYVGQLLPHKNPDFLLRAFHVLSTYLQPECHLVLAGASRSPRYQERFDRFLRELNVSNVHALGPVADDTLATLYRGAALFVTASSHEGFCVPPVEAMAFDIPVVARAFGALPETIDCAGVVIPDDAGPLLFAEAAHHVLRDDLLRRELVESGRIRSRTFRPEVARARFLRQIVKLF